MKYKFLSIAVLAVLSVSVSSCHSETADLKLDVARGDVFRCTARMDRKLTITTDVTMNMDQYVETDRTLTVDEVKADGHVIFSVVMDRFYIKSTVFMGIPISVEFDTDNPGRKGSESMARQFGRMKGRTYRLETDNRGKPEDLYDRPAPDTVAGIADDVAGNDLYFNHLPEKAVKKGDRYTITARVSDYVPVEARSTYTVKKITAGKVLLEVRSEFLKVPAGPDCLQVEEVRGNRTGNLEIDRKTGLTTRSEIKEDMAMDVCIGSRYLVEATGTTVFTCEKK